MNDVKMLKRFLAEKLADPLSVPRGILLMGRFDFDDADLCKDAALEAGFEFVPFDIGQDWRSSQMMERALERALAMSPAVIFVEGIDLALAGSDAPLGNGELEQWLLGFFSDAEYRGKVVLLATVEHPEEMSSALKRAGRFDVRIPLLIAQRGECPDGEEDEREFEDNILRETSDIGYIPDEVFMVADDGREISYQERFDELRGFVAAA